MKTNIIAKLVSGGQTGADRGGLDAAIDTSVPHGGWCPKGQRAEDGTIPERYRLVETDTPGYARRTEQNVIDSHATVVFCYGPPTGGSKKTVEFAARHSRPCFVVDLRKQDDKATAEDILGWLGGGGVHLPGSEVPPNPILNVAGSRESKAPGIQERVRKVMRLVLDFPGYPRGAE